MGSQECREEIAAIRAQLTADLLALEDRPKALEAVRHHCSVSACSCILRAFHLLNGCRLVGRVSSADKSAVSCIRIGVISS